MTNQEWIDEALRMIGILAEGQPSTAEQAGHALRVANEISDAWAEDGIVIAWMPNPELTDDCTLVGAEFQALRDATVVRVCSTYGRDPLQYLGFADQSMRRLQRIQVLRAIEPVEQSLPRAVGGSYDITTDGF